MSRQTKTAGSQNERVHAVNVLSVSPLYGQAFNPKARGLIFHIRASDVLALTHLPAKCFPSPWPENVNTALLIKRNGKIDILLPTDDVRSLFADKIVTLSQFGRKTREAMAKDVSRPTSANNASRKKPSAFTKWRAAGTALCAVGVACIYAGFTNFLDRNIPKETYRPSNVVSAQIVIFDINERVALRGPIPQ